MSRELESLAARLTANSVTRRTVDGREFIVAPVSMIVPGVLPGSKGPMLYTRERTERNPSEWDGVPLTFGHPSHPTTNAPLSASDPGVIERVGLGFVRDSHFRNGKLRANAWFDAEKTRRIAPNVYNAVLNGQRVEVSTGLFTQEAPAHPGATWNGRPYTHVVQDWVPDHLAVLVNETGACSLRDGCGLNVNSKRSGPMANPTKNDDLGKIESSSVSTPEVSPMQAGALGDTTFAAPTSNDDTPTVDPMQAGALGDGTFAASAPTENDDDCHCGGACQECQDKATKNAGNGTTAPSPTAKPASVKKVAMPKAAAAGSADAAQRIADYATNSGCPCGGTCRVCTHNAHPDQGRCPASGQYQPKRFKGKGRGEVQRAAVEGLNPPAGEDQANQVPLSDVKDEGNDTGADATTNACPCGGTCRHCVTANWCNQHGGDTCKVGGGRTEHLSPKEQQDNSGKTVGKITVKKGGQSKSLDDSVVGKDKETGRSVTKVDQFTRKLSKLAVSKSRKSSSQGWLDSEAAHSQTKAAVKEGTKAAHSAARAHHEEAARTHEKEGNKTAANVHKMVAALHGRYTKVRNILLNSNPEGINQYTKGIVTNRITTNDRSAAGLTKGGPTMTRQQMIQHLTTNCSCYKGKAGAVLNAMTSEQLEDLVNGVQAKATLNEFVEAGVLTANAGALPFSGKGKGHAEPDGDEDDEDAEMSDEDGDEPPARNGKGCSTTMNSGISAKELKELRTMAQNWKRHESAVKAQLVDRLTAHVEDADLKQRLTANHLRKSLNQLQDEVAAMVPVFNAAAPATNGLPSIEVEVPVGDYTPVGFGGFNRGGITGNAAPAGGSLDVSEDFAKVYGNN